MATNTTARQEGTDTEYVSEERTGNYPIPSVFLYQNETVEDVFCETRNKAISITTEAADVYFLPWNGGSGGIAAYRRDRTSATMVPFEYQARDARQLLEAYAPTEVPLLSTPVWMLDTGGEVNITWHARVRYAERVTRCVEPATEIRRLFRAGIPVGRSGSSARYYPPEDVLIVFENDDTPLVRTVFHPVDLTECELDHLHVCGNCHHLVDATDSADCSCCSAAVCSWCEHTLEDATPYHYQEAREACADV